MKFPNALKRQKTSCPQLVLAFALLGFIPLSQAATTNLADTPLANTSTSPVHPNVMFLLDDSGSMQWSYLPDAAFSYNYHKYIGYRSHLCNKLAYDPDTTYALPYKADGTLYPASSFTAAPYDGFIGSATVDLSTSYAAWRSNDSSSPSIPSGYNSDCWNVTSGITQCSVSGSNTLANTLAAAHYFMFKGNSNAASHLGDGTSQDPCKDNLYDTSASSGNKNWYKVDVGVSEQQNFANWYTYYRTRILAMKTAASRAFNVLDDTYRVGFMTIHNTSFSSNSTSTFLNLADFAYSDTSSQKALFYSKLFAIDPSSGTPLRRALSDVGRLYGNKFTSITDPVQYSCQQNFTILASDGYWTDYDSGERGYKLDGSTLVGDQDGANGVTKPSFDSGNYPSPYAGKTSDGLADVAYYYYHTDLRPTLSCDQNATTNPTGAGCVKSTGTNTDEDDVAKWLHMTTFTLGLGVNGVLNYVDGYRSGTSTDFNAIRQGSKAWPKATAGTLTTVDDLWHAAVNGRGTYFSAQNTQTLVSGLNSALTTIQATNGAAAAAATSNLQPVAGDNFAFVANYRTQKWDGSLKAYTIDLSTGALAATASWDAASLLDSATVGSTNCNNCRTIYTYSSAVANKLKTFNWDSLDATTEQIYFDSSKISQLSQYASWTADQTTNGTGTNLVDYLRGVRTHEDSGGTTANRLFRVREHRLGDIIHSQPVYVKLPQFHYADTGYATWAVSNGITNRTATVYVGANDGMLHAFNASVDANGVPTADSGKESWAYVPPMVLPNMWHLADNNYSTNHQFYVDGSPTAGDIYNGSSWATILVGGLNKGGRGYYAMDITDPANPKALWNFQVRNPSVTTCAATTAAAIGASDDCDLGYSYGTPIITKRPSDGKWVVLVTSGYNNVSPGDGNGFLYVLDAATGTILNKIQTCTGSTGAPCGFSQISNWVSNTDVDNTTTLVYGGDLNGGLWRVDLATNAAIQLAQLGAGANVQPITTKPELGLIGSMKIVYVGTGQYLGTPDLTSTQQQSLYAIHDSGTSLGNLRSGTQMVQQTITNLTTSTRTATANTVDWSVKTGWYVDFPSTGSGNASERVNVDPKLQLGVLTVATNVPTSTACNPSGYSWLYYFDYMTGSFITTSADHVVGERLDSLTVGLNIVQLGTGTKIIVTTADDQHIPKSPPANPSASGSKRVSWRELIQE